MAQRHVILILGPPGSGKTTHAHQLANQHGLTVYDRDDEQWHNNDRAYLDAVRHASRQPDAHLAVIRTGSTKLGRHRIIKTTQPTAVIVMDTTRDECERRVHQRQQDPAATALQLQGIATWFNDPPTPADSHWTL